MLAESTKASNQALTFAIFFASRLPATYLGLYLAATLSRVAEQYPNTGLAHIRLFQLYPYLLPGVVAGAMCAIMAIVDAGGLKEVSSALDEPWV